MPQTLPVEINGERLHAVDAPSEFTTAGSFVLDLLNRGESVHVHVRLGEALSRVARLDSGNHYVERGATLPIRIAVDESLDRSVTDTIEISTGYGAKKTTVSVTVDPPEDDPGVDVDERLGRPSATETASASNPGPLDDVRDSVGDVGVVPLVGVGVVALTVVLGVGLALNSPVVFVAVGIVLGVALSFAASELR
ncbi:hypothetical protein AUR64_10910 [Haloprofundus marisrubri]|uniref:Uncharacterized protein n=1 Tax=Haloprofundus marisrubri TaxID=1514971 RepID=A0A0W1RAI2_9EURY|nr:hypothetical protein [Haloprofundus marisrubri]KTG10098.1 hypothetical protein AUR64_10910 [Haloprofundus marisrubri]